MARRPALPASYVKQQSQRFWDAMNRGGRRRPIQEYVTTPSQTEGIQAEERPGVTMRGSTVGERRMERIMTGGGPRSPREREEYEAEMARRQRESGRQYDVSRQKFIAGEEARRARIQAGTEPVAEPGEGEALPYREKIGAGLTGERIRAGQEPVQEPPEGTTLPYQDEIAAERAIEDQRTKATMDELRARGLDVNSPEWQKVADQQKALRFEELANKMAADMSLEERKAALRRAVDIDRSFDRMQEEYYKATLDPGKATRIEIKGIAPPARSQPGNVPMGEGISAEGANARFDLDKSGGNLSADEVRYRKARLLVEHIDRFKTEAEKQSAADAVGITMQQVAASRNLIKELEAR